MKMHAIKVSPAILKSAVFSSVLIAASHVSQAQAPYGQSQYNQTQATEKSRPQVNDSLSRRKPELSELAEDNYSHVAASSVQIREVVLIDAGLLVELKRWIAKEATDEGRIVEDQSQPTRLSSTGWNVIRFSGRWRIVCCSGMATCCRSQILTRTYLSNKT